MQKEERVIIAATGHRPEKLGGYSDEVFHRLTALSLDYIRRTSPTMVISGMAQGWDLAWACGAIMQGTPVIAAVPFFSQPLKWPEPARERWRWVLQRAHHVAIVCDGEYAAWKMQRRNEWMVDRADRIAALWDGSSGGTANCVRSAQKAGKPLDNLWTEWTAQ